MSKKIVYFINDIAFFKNHFLPVACIISKTYEVSIISEKIDSEINEKYPEIKQYITPIIRTSVNPVHDLKLIFYLAALINKLSPDIIHNITVKPILYGSLVVNIINRKIKIINSVTGLGYAITNNHFFIKSIMKLLIRLFVSKSSHFLFLNKHDRNFYQAIGKGLNKNFTMINGSGVDKNEFEYKTPIQKDKIEIIYSGRILKDKGVLDLIYAINLLGQSFKDKIILKLYGKIDTQNPAHINENDFKKYLIPDLIEWEGFTSEIKHILEKSDIYCLPSYREGIPKSIVEAMAIGRPILTTNAPGCEDTVEEGINGFKVNICDAKALSQKLQKLVEEKELRIEMGKKSRVFFEKYFTLDKVRNQFLAVYEKVLEE